MKAMWWYLIGFQNYDPFLGALNIRCRIIMGIHKGTIILTATHLIVARNQEMKAQRDARAIRGALGSRESEITCPDN